MNNRFSTNWHDDYEEVKDAAKDLRTNWNLMTEYERAKYTKAFENMQKAYYRRVTDGAVGEFQNATRRYLRTGEVFDAEVQKEANSWDPASLNAEMMLATNRVQAIIHDGDQVAKELKDLYQEAVTSGNKTKIRAVTEALKGMHSKVGNLDDKLTVNGLAKEAEAKLKDMRMTEGIKQAVQQRNEERTNLLAIRQKLVEIAQVMGQGDPDNVYATGEYADALKMVQKDPATGQVIIKPEKTPETTGAFVPESTYSKG